MDLRVQDTARAAISWPSVFAGTFVFLAIEVTFGLLAAAIFPVTHGTDALATGPGIWMIVLSIIALYFGARAAAHMSRRITSKLDGMYCGLVTFGLAIFSSILLATMLVGNAVNSANALLSMTTANAIWLFITLILGGIAAGIGGASGTPELPKAAATEQQPATLKPAA
jgi:hypothetical protein